MKDIDKIAEVAPHLANARSISAQNAAVQRLANPQYIDNLKQGIVNSAYVKTAEHIENHRRSLKASGAVAGKNNGFAGRTHTEQARELNRQAHLGQVPVNRGQQHSADAIEKMRKPRTTTANMRKPRTKMLTCPHCDRTGAAGNMARYHMENCRWKKKITGITDQQSG